MLALQHTFSPKYVLNIKFKVGLRLFYVPRAGLRSNIHAVVQTCAGPRACFRLLLILIF